MRLLLYTGIAITIMHMSACMYNLASAKTIVLNSKNVITFESDFNQQSTAELATKALSKDLGKGFYGPMYLFIDSPGGSVDAGIEMIQNLNSLKTKVHTITTFAASMGFHTVQGVKGKRYILENGTLMSHKARGGFQGEFPGQLDQRYNFYKRRLERLDAIVVKRTKGKHTLESYKALYENEYWCDGQDCVDQGFADSVVTVRCDKSLKGTKKVLGGRYRMFGSRIDIYLIKSKCPIITGPLGIKAYINGEPADKALKKIGSETLRLHLRQNINTKIDEISNKKKNVTR